MMPTQTECDCCLYYKQVYTNLITCVKAMPCKKKREKKNIQCPGWTPGLQISQKFESTSPVHYSSPLIVYTHIHVKRSRRTEYDINDHLE